jgi:transcriptional regulator with XRE-family HTH domain
MNTTKTTRIRATDDLKREFARRLMERLADADMNQSDLARRVKISKDAVSTYARGRSIPSPDTLLKISKVLDIDPQELLPKRFDTATLQAPFQLTMLDDGRVSMSVQATMSFETASKVMELLRREKITSAS